MRLHLTLGCGLLLAAVASGQSLSSYVTFGTGCPGTGAGGKLPGVIVPAGHNNAWANSNNYWGVGRNNQRYQQVYLGTDFGKPTVITGYQLRPDEKFPNTNGGTQTYQVTLGYTTQTPASISGNFASNYDTSKGPGTVLFSGNVNLPPWSSGTPKLDDWHVTVRFTRPFVFAFSPTENLLFEVANSSSSSVSGAKDAVSGTGANTTRIVSNVSATAASGNIYRNSGLLIKFNTPGAGGAIPVLGSSGRPVIGNQLTVTLSQGKASTAALLTLGASNTQWGPFKLPFDLSPLGASGCSLLATPDTIFAFSTDSTGAASAIFNIPASSALIGVRFHNQWWVLDQGANGLGLAFSNGGTATIG